MSNTPKMKFNKINIHKTMKSYKPVKILINPARQTISISADDKLACRASSKSSLLLKSLCEMT